MSGLDANDTLSGGDGADTLDGGTGNDSMTGGNGDDTYIIDSLTDKLLETSTGGTDNVLTALSLTLANFIENLTLTGSANVNAAGNTANNVLTGNAGNNLLSGGSNGNDTIRGLAGHDTLDGGNGNDDLQGGNGDDFYIVDALLDLVTEAANQGNDSVQSSVTYTLGDDVENLTLSGSLAATGTGNALGNLITGNSASNTLIGLVGNDTLDGGSGNDVQTGGSGADHFVFTSAVSGLDTITDFNALDGGLAEGDLLQFTGLLQGSFAYLAASTFTASGNTQARVVGSQVQFDFDGNGAADLSITLTGLVNAAQLTALDFLFT